MRLSNDKGEWIECNAKWDPPWYRGQIVSMEVTDSTASIFAEYSNVVQSNIMSQLDEVEEAVADLNFGLPIEGKWHPIALLQITNGSDICFQVAISPSP